MQISCEKCSTAYTLDDRLIPPGGAPVQCTRCGHVFIASTEAEARRDRSGTQIFGIPKPPPSPPPSVSRPMVTAATPAPMSSSQDGRTQIFGRSGSAPQPPSAGPAHTQMFGAVPAPPAPAAPAPSHTQMFGAVQAPPPAAPAASHHTQMFGAVPPPPPAPAPSHHTQMFGAVPAPPPPAPSPSTTQMFGAVQVPPAPAAHPAPPAHTQMFGAAGAPPSAAPPPSTTQMFGAVKVPPAPAAPSPSTTQMFGAVKVPPAASPPSPSTTQMFGAPSMPPPAASPPRSSTAMFGAVPMPPEAAGLAPEPPPEPKTATYGSAGIVQPAPRSTAMFGAVKEPAPDWRRTTAMFGASPSMPKVTFGGAANTPISTPALDVTDPAYRAGDPADIDPAMATTQRMPGDVVARALASREPKRTQVFEPKPPPATDDAVATPVATPAVAQAATPTETPSVYVDDAYTGDAEIDDEAYADTAPRGYAKVELPPEASDLPVLELADRSSRAQSARRHAPRWPWVVLGVLALAGGGFAAYRLVSARLNAIPVQIVASREEAMALVRRDDRDSRARAIAQLEEISQAFPEYLDARADLVAALALEMDDARAEARALEGQIGVLHARMARLDHLKTPSDWQNRVNVMADRVQQLRARARPLADSAAALDKRLDGELQALDAMDPGVRGAVSGRLALSRARAMAFSVRGSDQGPAFADQYRTLGADDGWAEIAFAEYSLNRKVAADVLGTAAGRLESLSSRDSAFIRPHVLSARIAAAQDRHAAMTQPLEAAIALNPAHAMAKVLLEWTQAIRTQQAEQEATAEQVP